MLQKNDKDSDFLSCGDGELISAMPSLPDLQLNSKMPDDDAASPKEAVPDMKVVVEAQKQNLIGAQANESNSSERNSSPGRQPRSNDQRLM